MLNRVVPSTHRNRNNVFVGTGFADPVFSIQEWATFHTNLKITENKLFILSHALTCICGQKGTELINLPPLTKMSAVSCWPAIPVSLVRGFQEGITRVPEYEAGMKYMSDEAGITLCSLVFPKYQECPVHQFGLHRAGIQVVCTAMRGRALLLPNRQRFICLTAEQTPFCATTGSACPLASEKWNQAVNSYHLFSFRHSAHKMPSPPLFLPAPMGHHLVSQQG
jgi:hypothetical protein